MSDPANPERVAFQETDYAIHNCYLDGAVGYFTGLEADGSSLVVVDLAGDDPTEVARWSITSQDERWADVPWTLWPVHDIWVQDGLAALAHWDAGTWLVDVSDPADPQYVADVGGRSPADLADLDERAAHEATVALPGNSHFVTFDDDRSVLAVGEEAWNVDETGRGPGGITLYDVSDPTDPTRLSRVEPPVTPDATFGGTWTTAHNFELRGDRLYSAWYQGGVKLHDVSDPAVPEELSWWRQPDEASFWTARVGVPGEFFVASSLGDPDPTREAVYVFPDEIGQQANPPALANVSTGGGNGSIQQTPTTPTATPTTTTDGQASLGLGVGLGATLYGAWRARR
ncbi:LVIVD repeat-containing protein [Halobacteriaceae archaeon GCM10025711]